MDIASMDIERAKVYAKNKGINKIIVIDENGNIDAIKVAKAKLLFLTVCTDFFQKEGV